MERINFVRVFGEGFGSFQKAFNFPLKNEGINMISGSNGNGKTTIFSVLVYALYGITLKGTTQAKIATWKRKRKDYFRGVRAGVEFVKGEYTYLAVRHIGFKGTTKGLAGADRMMVFKRLYGTGEHEQSDLVTDEKHKGDMQEYLIELLGLKDKAFLNSILFGQRMKRLVESTGDDKRKLFEELFDLDWMVLAKEKADAKKAELHTAVELANSKITTLLLKVSNFNQRIEDGKRILSDFKATHDSKVTQYQTEESNATLALNNLEKQVAKLKTTAAKYKPDGDAVLRKQRDEDGKAYDTAFKASQKAGQTLSQFDDEEEKCTANIGKLNTELTKVRTDCFYCGGKLSAVKLKEVKGKIEQEIEKERAALKQLGESKKSAKVEYDTLKKAAENAEQVYKLMKKAYDDYTTNIKSIQEAYNDWSLKTALYKAQEKVVLECQQRLDHVKAEKPPVVDVKQFETDRDLAQKEADELSMSVDTKAKELQRVLWWISKGFSASGLKAFVFNAMLGQLNLHVDKYAARLGVRVKFSVDLSKASKPFVTTCYFEGEETDYTDLSGGEKQRVDIALAFAMHDMVQSFTAPMNILVMDEVFEGLDGEGVETVYDLIRLKADNERSIYLITHSQLLDSLYTKHIGIGYNEELETSYIE